MDECKRNYDEEVFNNCMDHSPSSDDPAIGECPVSNHPR